MMDVGSTVIIVTKRLGIDDDGGSCAAISRQSKRRYYVRTSSVLYSKSGGARTTPKDFRECQTLIKYQELFRHPQGELRTGRSFTKWISLRQVYILNPTKNAKVQRLTHLLAYPFQQSLCVHRKPHILFIISFTFLRLALRL
jgi:hypothetical protein